MTTDVPWLAAAPLLLSVAAAMLLGCLGGVYEQPQGGGDRVSVRLGQEFKLRVGQRAAVKGERLKVRFASVANDSRCPEGVTCVWAGNAEVLVEAEAGGGPTVLGLNTHGGADYPKEGRHRQYSIGLVALDPRPGRNGGVKAADYVATLVIRKE